MAGPPERRRSRLPFVTAGFVLLAGVALLTLGRAPAGVGRPAQTGETAGATSGPLAEPLASAPREPGREVYGFVPYWEMDDGIAGHLAETRLTTLALFSVSHRANGALATEANGFGRLDGRLGTRLIREAHDRGTRVELTYTSFGADRNRVFYEDSRAQARWLEALVRYVGKHGYDGVNVDVEGLPIDLIPSWAGFVSRLRAALRVDNPNAQVSVATQANELGAAMALAASTAGADRIFLMGYDYRTARTAPGASAPLERTDGEVKDLVWSLDVYQALGVPADRLILGLPLYGVTWPVLGPGFGAAAVGKGDAWVPRRNLAAFRDPATVPTYDPTESVEFYALPSVGPAPASAATGRWNAVYYDSPRSLAPKLALANSRGLAGAGFWAIGYERGLPDYTALIAAFRDGDMSAAASR
jgi:spore germination protein